MNRLTRTQAATLHRLDKQGPVIKVPVGTGQALATAGYVNIVPAAIPMRSGVMIRLADRGKQWLAERR